MKKPHFLSKLIFGLGVLLSGLSQAQTSSGYTHAINFTQDCSLGYALFDADFSMQVYTGGAADFRVQTRLYKGDWNPGLANSVINDVLIATTTSTAISVGLVPYGFPIAFSTANFYATPPHYAQYRNGAYRMTTTLQISTSPGVWSNVYTTPLSGAYGYLDVPPYTAFGDFAEVALVDDLKALGFDFTINGTAQYSTPPDFITCTAVNLVLDNVKDWRNSFGTATLTVEKGFFTPSTYIFNSSSSSSTTFAVDGANKNLTSLFSLGSYSGALRVTYQLPDDYCAGVYTPVVKTMTLSATTAAFVSSFLAPTGSAVVSGCGSSVTTKALSTTWSITSTMPSSTNANTYKCQLKTAIGWQGATSAGLADLTYSGAYAIDVYEVDPSTGVRLSGAPSLYLKSGAVASNDQVNFNEYGYGVLFDNSNPPYYTSTVPIEAANPNGTGEGYDYFHTFYEEARTNSATVGNLTSLSARVFCSEVSLYLTGGCSESKKNYFRIANNGNVSGGTVRLATSTPEENEEEYTSLEVYPNPTKGELNIPVNGEDTHVSIVIMDNLGKQVMSIADVKAKNGTINIENLTAGIYFYTINKDNSVYRGKIVKQ
jgi:hypothetical protein